MAGTLISPRKLCAVLVGCVLALVLVLAWDIATGAPIGLTSEANPADVQDVFDAMEPPR